jgi:demethylmenaquinone methyltransferase/2-methoxy-6-polyprenyl-1,4-benzoquinol methylase
VGKAVTGDRDAYQYLVESIRKFPSQGEMKEMVQAAGFQRVEVRNLTGGIAAIHSGWKL